MKLRKFERDSLYQQFGGINWDLQGRILEVVGNMVEAWLPRTQLGTIVEISILGKNKPVLAEVVGFRKDRTLLMPYGELSGIAAGAPVSGAKRFDKVPVGNFLLGHIVDPFIRPLTGSLEIPEGCHETPVEREAPNPMERQRIDRPFELGVKAMDGLLTFGEGQRLAVMAGSGVGKSVLMGMMARHSEADINVIGLIGERGREVRDFIEGDLATEGMKKSIVVAATSDQSPLTRLRAAKVATAIAESFAETGKKVLLFMDSLTRVAQAQREIGLSVGEPPTAKGYPPSVYAMLPRLLERCGPQKRGSISGIYTVLADGDDFNDPIPDAVRSILDGHVILTRELASKNHFPAIDIMQSLSRVMNDIVDRDQWSQANTIRELISIYNENIDMVQFGDYTPGRNPTLDQAIRLMPEINKWLRQDMNETSTFQDSIAQMKQLVLQAQYSMGDSLQQTVHES